jgi:hypothetical protein
VHSSHSTRGNTLEGGPAVRCDRPRRARLDFSQQHAGRRAIGLIQQATHRKQDERDQHGQARIDHGSALIARAGTRVAERARAWSNKRESHCQ